MKIFQRIKSTICVQQCNLANFYTCNLLSKNYYDVLGITPKATKSQIKKSYYDLSLRYHPDHNKDDLKAANKFLEITEAYEVLGDVAKRRMYDKGLHGFDSSPVSDAESATYSKFHRTVNRKSPTVGGRTHAYNFDEWYKAHYQHNFQRKQQEKRRFEEYIREKNKEKESREQNDSSFFGGFLLISSIFLGIYFLDSYVERKRPR